MKRVKYKSFVQIRTTSEVISATCTCPAGGTPTFSLIMIDKSWRAVTPLTIHSCFKKSGFPTQNLVDVDDTLTEFNVELWEALPEPDLTFDDYVLGLTRTLLYGELYLTLKLWLWTTIIQKVM
ncbi:hypothetical protein TNCT_224441 [Trichonephila clavata]|uniref:Uncharacterized protein n=1 Tax=Trichonephila clavata TaxID=2740835 RepID=A0A8X6FPC2_TRICU|nr:hypothetical protein TNCT_224441 [Trichonephila clavata]